MKPISTFVESELLQDEVALEALRRGVLNLSQYAKQIQTTVAERRMEAVSLGSIVTALSRLTEQYKAPIVSQSRLVFDQISLFTTLEEVTFRATDVSLPKMQDIYASHERSEDFFELTVGKNEVTFITTKELSERIKEIIAPQQPIIQFEELMGITFRFPEHLFDEPAVLYKILRVFALEHISIVEFVSTYREATVILRSGDMDAALGTIKRFFDSSTTSS